MTSVKLPLFISFLTILGVASRADAQTKRTEAEADTDSSTQRTKFALEERLSFNTEKQFQSSITGIYSFTREIFGVFSGQFGQYPASTPREDIRNFGGTAQAGYNTGLWGLDASYSQNYSTVSKLTHRSFGAGLTFAYLPSMLEGRQSEIDLLKAANQQTYQTELKGGELPVFWARVGASTTQIKSPLLETDTTAPDSQSQIRQFSLNLDVHYPVNEFSVLSGGLTTYSYSKDIAQLSTELYNTTSEQIFLLAGSLQNMPAFMSYLEYSWQITQLDSFIPRIQATLIGATKQWEPGGSLTWRRRLMTHLYMTPSYEIGVLGSYVYTGATLSLFHDF